nr:PEP-CTERM sorting domain-containing protein [uncultured Roseateles sp.]
MSAKHPEWRFGLRPLIAAAVLLCAAPARAGDIAYIDMFRNVGFMQTGNGEVLTDNGSFLSTSINTLGGDSYASASLVFPGPASPLDLPMQSSTRFGYQTGAYATKADMEAAFPQGHYEYSLQPAGAAVAASFELGDDHYAQSRPFLDGSSYTDLQGLNAAAPVTLHFSAFATNGGASNSFVFFTLYDYTLGQFVFNDGFLPATTATELLPAGTLQPGHSFAYELIFSSRQMLPGDGTEQGAQVGFELRTSGLFSTAAVPEPQAAWLLLAGLGLVASVVRRRRQA